MRFLFLLLFAFGIVTCHAQYNWAAGGMYYPGFLFAHTDDARNLEAHIKGFEISLAKINNKDKYWSRYYRNAEIGYNFIYMDLGNPEVTGKVYALSTNFQFRISRRTRHYWAVRLGTGLGYITKKFDFYTNRKNMAIGSNLNGEIQLAFIYQTRLSSRLSMKTGLGFTHFSNGAIRVPNLGINMPSLFLGLQIGYGKANQPLADTVKAFKTTKKRYEVLLNYAFKERFTAKPREFHIISAGFRWQKPMSPVRKWYLGADLVWDPTHPYNHDLRNPNPRVGIDNSTEFALLIGHRYDIGRFGLVTDVGFYLLNPYQTKYFSYQRIGFRYELNADWFLNAALKVHFGTADYFEWGIGYKFKTLKK